MTAARLHPARRRRLAARTPPAPPHDVALRPLGGPGPQLIVSAEEQDFLPALFADLQADDWRARLAARRAVKRGKDGVAELSQPVHQRFHLVLFEAACRTPGYPRVDPGKLSGMGLVLRRREGARWRGWMAERGQRRGWLDVTATADLDPDPAPPGAEARPRALAALDRLMAERRGEAPLAEKVFPLHVAPPEICAARGRTILFAVLPLSSSETTEATETFDYTDLPAAEAAALEKHFSSYLKARPEIAMPRAGQKLDPEWRPLDKPVAAPDEDPTEPGRLFAFARFLQQLVVELGMQEPLPTSAALKKALAGIALPMERDRWGRVTREMRGDDFVEAAIPILLSGEANSAGLTMPLSWPRIDAAQGAALTGAALAALGARFAQVAPKTPKFDADADQYAARAFIRVAGHEHCPPRLVWSDYTEPFRIRPWWDSDAPPRKVSLPSLAQLRNVKPGVAFEMPPELANLLQGDPKKLMEGDGSTSGVGIGWLCSFSIPIITLCAFIVLNIFLSLFNLIFRWMLWIKICIPYPRPK